MTTVHIYRHNVDLYDIRESVTDPQKWKRITDCLNFLLVLPIRSNHVFNLKPLQFAPSPYMLFTPIPHVPYSKTTTNTLLTPTGPTVLIFLRLVLNRLGYHCFGAGNCEWERSDIAR